MVKGKKEHEFEEELDIESEAKENNSEKAEKNVVDSIWKFFSSMRLGIFLLIIIAVASIWGTIFVPQNEYGQPDYLAFYGAFWFRGILFLLMMNLLICSINRWKLIKRALGEPKVKVGENFVKKLSNFEAFKSKDSYEEAVANVESAIKSRGYRTFTETEGDKTYIAADKGRHGVLGSFITHLAFIVIPLAALYGSFTGFEGFAMAPEGETFKVSQVVEPIKNVTDDFEVKVEKFWIDYRPDGTVEQYYSKLSVIDNGQVQFTKDINVNDPLQYKGVKFYQSSYEFIDQTKLTAETFAYEAAEGSAENQEQSQEQNQENQGNQEKPEANITPKGSKTDFTVEAQNYAPVPGTTDLYVQILQFIPDFDPMNPQQSKSNEPNNPAVIYALFKGNQRVDMNYSLLNKPITFEGTAIVFKDFDMKQGAATGLSVRKDPGVWYVWLGCFFLLAGMFLSYYLQHRKIWAVVTKTDKVTLIDIGGTTEKNKLAFEDDFENIIERIEE